MNFGVSYFGNRILKHAITDLMHIKNSGFSYVVHTFSEFDLEFHYDNISDIVKATQDIGLKAYLNPWGVGNVFGGEPYSNFVSKHSADACQVLDNNTIIPMACPNSPIFHDYMNKWLEQVIRSKADTVFWDEPHFHQQGFLSSVPGHWGCRCKFCKNKFNKLFGYNMPLEENEDIIKFKHFSLKNFLIELMKPLIENNVKNILYLTANMAPDLAKEEWEYYANIKYLNSISTGPYWIWHKKSINSVSEYSKVIKKISSKYNLDAQIWLQCCKIPKGRENEISPALELIINSGVENIAVWGYEGCAHECWISCENPQEAWEITLNSISKYK